MTQKIHWIVFAAWDLNNDITTQLQDTGGRGCLKSKLIFTTNGDMHAEFPDKQKPIPLLLARGHP